MSIETFEMGLELGDEGVKDYSVAYDNVEMTIIRIEDEDGETELDWRVHECAGLIIKEREEDRLAKRWRKRSNVYFVGGRSCGKHKEKLTGEASE